MTCNFLTIAKTRRIEIPGYNLINSSVSFRPPVAITFADRQSFKKICSKESTELMSLRYLNWQPKELAWRLFAIMNYK